MADRLDLGKLSARAERAASGCPTCREQGEIAFSYKRFGVQRGLCADCGGINRAAGIAMLPLIARVHELELEVLQKHLRSQVARFALCMEDKLKQNDHKGGWSDDSPSALLQRLREETDELAVAIDMFLEQPFTFDGQRTAELVRKEAADVANFAMMVADVCREPK